MANLVSRILNHFLSILGNTFHPDNRRERVFYTTSLVNRNLLLKKVGYIDILHIYQFTGILKKSNYIS